MSITHCRRSFLEFLSFHRIAGDPDRQLQEDRRALPSNRARFADTVAPLISLGLVLEEIDPMKFQC
jgi:hypothetical protein